MTRTGRLRPASLATVAFATVALLTGLLVAPALAPASATVQGLIPDGPNAPVRAIVTNPSDPSTTYIAGDFTQWGPQTGGFAVLSKAGGDLNRNFPPVAGYVRTAVSDGAGGYYIGGQFTAVGGVPRNNAAHILANGTVDPNWNPDPRSQTTFTDGVFAMQRVGSDVIMAGRYFFGGAGLPQGLSRVHPDGSQAWTVRIQGGGGFSCAASSRDCVLDFAISESTIYVGGGFNSIGGSPKENAAAFALDTGAPVGWSPSLNNTVKAVEALPGAIALGGEFTTVGGTDARRLVAFATVEEGGGWLSAWTPEPNNEVTGLAAGPEGLYAVGSFTGIAGETRNRAAALSTDTSLAASVTAWNPDVNGFTEDVSATDDYVYLAGPFSNVGGTAAAKIARVSATGSGALDTGWTPVEPGYSQERMTVDAIDAQVLVGGSFTVVGGQEVPRVLAIDGDGNLQPGFDQLGSGPDGPVYSLATDGSTLYLGGNFSAVDGSPRARVAALDAGTGALNNWASGLSIDFGTVNDLVLDTSASHLYLGGSFAEVNGTGRNGLAVLSTTDAALGTWGTGRLAMGASVQALDLDTGSSPALMYVGGSFEDDQGEGITNLAAINASNQTDLDFPSASGSVSTLDYEGGTLVVGGGFGSVGGEPRTGLASIDTGSPAVTSWQPDPNGAVTTVTLRDGVAYVGGEFGSVDGESVPGGLTTIVPGGTLTDPLWSPAVNRVSGESVYAIEPGDAGVWIGASTSMRNEGTGGSFLLLTNSIDVAPPPTDVIAVRGGVTGEINLFWTAPDNTGIGDGAITGYRVWQAESPYDDWQFTVDTDIDSPMLTVGGLTNGTRYRFRVAAITDSGVGARSAPSNWARPADTSLVPGVPQNVSGTGVPVGTIEVTGDAPTSWGGGGATGKALRGIASIDGIPMGFCQNIGAPVTALDCTITGLTQSTNYAVTATALNSLNLWGSPATAIDNPVLAQSIFPPDPEPAPEPSETGTPTPRPSATSATRAPTPQPTRSTPVVPLRTSTLSRVSVATHGKRATKHRVTVRATVRPAQGRVVQLQRLTCERSRQERTCSWRTVRKTRTERVAADRVTLRTGKVSGRSSWRLYLPQTATARAVVSRVVRG